MSTRIVMARHGETDWNRDRRVQGHSDIPLNAAGRAQARSLAAQLAGERFHAVYASDLARARETAVIVSGPHNLGVAERVELREKDFGSWEGLTDAEIRRRFPDAAPGAWGDGETTDEMASRVVTALLGIAAAHVGRNILVVTHGGPIRAVFRSCGDDPGPIGNCEVTRFEVEGNRLSRLD